MGGVRLGNSPSSQSFYIEGFGGGGGVPCINDLYIKTGDWGVGGCTGGDVC